MSTFEFEFEIPNSPGPEFDKIDRQDESKDRRPRSLVRINSGICEVNGACSQVCPEDVIDWVDGAPVVVKPEACTECWICVENCVSGAIDIG
jgi:MinD superfamily P-loop ATPase